MRGVQEAVIPAGLGSWKRGTSPSQNPDVAQDRTAAQAARPWLNYGAAPRTLPISSLTETLFSCHQKANKTQAEEDKK